VQNFILKFIGDLNRPIPSISISIFRFFFALILLIQTYYFIAGGFIEKNIIQPFVLFPFIKGLEPASKAFLIIFGYIMLIANVGMLFNKFTRIATFVFLICFTYFWLLDKGYFNNHYYFISLICFLIFLAEKNPSFSKKTYTTRINLFALQAMVFMVYFIAGLNKLNPYWLFDLQPMQHILEVKAEITNNPFFKQNFIIICASYFGLIFDVCIGFLLFFKRTRLFAFVMILFFHLTNYYLFKDVGEIGVFPFLMISTLILFIDPNHLCQILKIKEQNPIQKSNSVIINKFLLCFLVLQFILPFRHVLFKGNVDYNGIGQRFSWRMKIMYKESDINYFIVNKMTQEKYAVNVATMLTNRQYNNLKYFPDLIVPLAKKIQLEARESFGIKNAKITCEYTTSFMGKHAQPLFSPKLDLAKIKSHTLTNKWLFPLKK